MTWFVARLDFERANLYSRPRTSVSQLRSKPMRTALTALSFAGAVAVASCQNAGAVAVDAAAMKEAASAASTIQLARFYGHATRHSVVKCYRELVVGPYECRRFYRWW
jgi:hypothetical protein